jgi:hypothetical protein
MKLLDSYADRLDGCGSRSDSFLSKQALRKTQVILGPVCLRLSVHVLPRLHPRPFFVGSVVHQIQPCWWRLITCTHLAASLSDLALTLLLLLLFSLSFFVKTAEQRMLKKVVTVGRFQCVGRKNGKDRKKCTVKRRCLL